MIKHEQFSFIELLKNNDEKCCILLRADKIVKLEQFDRCTQIVYEVGNVPQVTFVKETIDEISYILKEAAQDDEKTSPKKTS